MRISQCHSESQTLNVNILSGLNVSTRDAVVLEPFLGHTSGRDKSGQVDSLTTDVVFII